MASPTLALASMPAGATLSLTSISILGSTRREVLAELERAERFDITVEVAEIGIITGAENRANRTRALEPLVAGRIRSHAPVRPRSTHHEPFIYIGDSIPNHHFDNGSRHTCWCGKTLGRRSLNETAEHEIIEAVIANGGDVRTVAEAYSISASLVTTTMKRYGYVRASRVATASAA